eukprot:TRINITY_DN84_c0_g2_i1.p1 TRINITY_DN84_c0_g2~~TRINITY_DN84_c0_g2_i1.p1  ORF type:complete len:230 (-),score=67.94 TRINITY_DN84_c0_g2_i1:29-643(-)
MAPLKHIFVFFVVFASMWELAVGEEEEVGDGEVDDTAHKEELLHYADANHDGRVSLDEFIAMIGGDGQEGTDYLVKVAPVAFKEADRDGDGYVGVDEVVDLNKKMMEIIEEDGGDDDSGVGSEEELLQHADGDQDGRVSLDEFITMIGGDGDQAIVDYVAKVAPSVFKKADRDGDGYVGVDEIVDLNKKMMEIIEEYPGHSKEL